MQWYVLRSKPNKEDFFYNQLFVHRVKVLYPRIWAQAVNPRARKVRPYFPGYLFTHIDLHDITTYFLIGCPVQGVWSRLTQCLPKFLRPWLPPSAAVCTKSTRRAMSNWPALIQARPLSFEKAFFAGREAVFDSRLPDPERVRVLLKLLYNQQVPVDMPAGQTRPKK